MAALFIGLMSGTSLDGVDGVLVDLAGDKLAVLQHASAPFPPALKAEFLALNRSGPDELHRSALAANNLCALYAQVVSQLLEQAQISAQQVQAIGAHGQTVRHQPQSFGGPGYTWQLNQPALLAELTGITVVADFRSRDLAAGGQGAPLVPAFHHQWFAQTGQVIGVLNLGGISNLSVLGPGPSQTIGFDCGPANALLDHWCQLHTGRPFDEAGRWAAQGVVQSELLTRLLAEPYFDQLPPKSTGRDLFNPDWLTAKMQGLPLLRPEDIQATLTELTALCCAQAVLRHGAKATRLLVCGGGAYNTHLMLRLQHALPTMVVQSTDQHGLPALQVEAAAFAWLAQRALNGLPGNLPEVTGARGPRVLGAVYR